jgi:Helix-turn-helix domain
VDGADGGAVFVFGQATFAFATDDEVGRRLAAVQLVATDIASAVAIAAGFGIGLATLWRWKVAYDAGGVAGLIPAKPGPKRPTSSPPRWWPESGSWTPMGRR